MEPHTRTFIETYSFFHLPHPRVLSQNPLMEVLIGNSAASPGKQGRDQTLPALKLDSSFPYRGPGKSSLTSKPSFCAKSLPNSPPRA